jgi:hypothetical protein
MFARKPIRNVVKMQPLNRDAPSPVESAKCDLERGIYQFRLTTKRTPTMILETA